MAAITRDADTMRSNSKRIQRCRVVDMALSNIADADVINVGPGLLTAAFIETGVADSGDGEVGMIYSRSAETITFDGAGTHSGTLRLFYGQG